MASSLSTFSLLLIFSLFTTTLSIPDPHDYLPKYGLPKGLLPGSPVSYSVSADGHFTVDLGSPCYVTFGTDLVLYDRNIKGKFSSGAITEIWGIQVKQLFIWIPLTALFVTPGGAEMTFLSGILWKNLPIALFTQIPSCEKPPAIAAA